MKQCYFHQETRSIADLTDIRGLTEYKGDYLINRINVPRQHRGRGHARDLLKQILTDADHEKIILVLEPSPSDGLNKRQLVSWYQRHGFNLVKPNGYMLREPQDRHDWERKAAVLKKGVHRIQWGCNTCGERKYTFGILTNPPPAEGCRGKQDG